MTAYDDWLGSLPEGVQIEQRAWERRRRCRAMYEHGMTCSQIAAKEGISRGRAWQLVIKAHHRRFKASPAEHWCRLGTDGHQLFRELDNLPKKQWWRLRHWLRGFDDAPTYDH